MTWHSEYLERPAEDSGRFGDRRFGDNKGAEFGDKSVAETSLSPKRPPES